MLEAGRDHDSISAFGLDANATLTNQQQRGVGTLARILQRVCDSQYSGEFSSVGNASFSEAGVVLAGRSGLSIAALEESIRQRKSVRSQHASVESYRAYIAKTSLEIVRSRQ